MGALMQGLNPLQRAWTLEDISNLSSELHALSQENPSPSRTLIELNQLFVAVEGYLQARGLEVSSSGLWVRKHWSYRLLEQLSSKIQDCKDQAAGIDHSLLRFVDEQLLPKLYEEAIRLN